MCGSRLSLRGTTLILRPLSHTKPKPYPPKVVYNPAQTAALHLDLALCAVKIADNLYTSAHLARYPA